LALTLTLGISISLKLITCTCTRDCSLVNFNAHRDNAIAVSMGLKRENSDAESDVQEPNTKRRRDQPSSKPKLPEPKTDSVYGQRSVFPGLDHPTHPSDDDLEFEDEADALAYLKSVR
jgi:hypothetical protein